ncbi:MAG: triose-phosphate isomerase [Chitinophagales bacterium]
MRKHYVIGNWKMNLTWEEVYDLCNQLKSATQSIPKTVSIGVTPSSPYIPVVMPLLPERIKVGSQMVSAMESGACTGQVSAKQLDSLGTIFSLIGHSESRALWNESDEELAQKVSQCLETELEVVFCIGESLEVRESGDYLTFLMNQIQAGLFHLDAKQMKRIILAYEPIWAIGTGKSAQPDQIQEVHQALRGMIATQYGEEVAQSFSILYGGSVKPVNAENTFALEDVDGALVGGASLNAESFTAIIEACVNQKSI